MISSIILVNSNLLVCIVGLSQQSGCFFKFVPKKIACHKKARQRRAYAYLFNLFLCPISIYYIPHNYVIPQACHMPFRQLIPPLNLTIIEISVFKNRAHLAEILKLEHISCRSLFENFLPSTPTEITFKNSFNLARS